MKRVLTGMVAALFFVACGGSIATIDDASDGGTAGDGASLVDGARSDGGVAGDGGCVDAVEGAACTKGAVACEPGNVDPCCRGYVWSCDGTWKKLGVKCACRVSDPDAGSFPCGTQTCDGSQYCTTTTGGPPLPDGGAPSSSSCVAIPAACSKNPDCTCLKAATTNGACQCAEKDGHLSVTCYAP